MSLQADQTYTRLCAQYFRYISGDSVVWTGIEKSVIKEAFLYEERILSMLCASQDGSKMLDDYMISRRVAIGFLSALWSNAALHGSVFLVKGLSIEKFYEKHAARHAFDFDLVLDSDLTLLKIEPYLKQFLYERTQCETAQNRHRYIRSNIGGGGISIEINVGGVAYSDNAKKIDWRFLSLGAYAAYYEGAPILTPSDSMTFLLLLISLYEKKSIPLRDVCDMALLSSKFQFSQAEQRMIVEFLEECGCIAAIDDAIALMQKYKSSFPVAAYKNSENLLQGLKQMTLLVSSA